MSPDLVGTLALLRTKGLGPVRVRALLDRFGTPDAVRGAPPAALEAVDGIGPKSARSLARDTARSMAAARTEIDRAESLGASLVTEWDPSYPPLLRQLPDRPVVLAVLGELRSADADRFTIGIVGSRRCTAYGLEQADRFGAALARAGLCVVSGGARGIDTAAHRGALAAGGRTIVVLGCGLSHVYPPENRALFERIVESGGAIVSELPVDAPPSPEHFPVRNRIISGMSLGVLVVEAGIRSGALITARQAVEDHGREVFAIPGRIDSDTCAGSLDLIKRGGAMLVTEPADIISGLESAARHLDAGTHEAILGAVMPRRAPSPNDDAPAASRSPVMSAAARRILDACTQPQTLDALVRDTGLDAAELARELTMLELGGFVCRRGGQIERRSAIRH